MSDNVEDVNTTRQEETGGASGAQKAGQAAQAAGKAAKAAKNLSKAAKAAKNAKNMAIIGKLIALLWPVALFLLILILLIGAVSFITTAPGMMMDKILETSSGLWNGFKSVFQGNSAYISEEAQNSLAEYIQNMGYDVVGFGFATPEQVEENDNVKSKYLLGYLLADYNTYAIDSGTRNFISGIWTSIFKQNVPGMTGMIYFDSITDKIRSRSK